jgi:hypothetical protein
MSANKKQVGPSSSDRRATLEEDVEAFLKKGNKIEQIPSGVSGQQSVASKKSANANADKKSD